MPESTETFGKHTRTIKYNQLFLVDNTHGEIPLHNTSGLGFYRMDTRFLSCLEIRLNDTPPVPLLSSTETGHSSAIVYTNGPLCAENELNDVDQLPPEKIQLKRESLLFDQLYERFTLANYSARTLKITLTLTLAVDFRDMFEIRGIVPVQDEDATVQPTVEQGELVFARRDRSDHLLQTRLRIKGANPVFQIGDETTVVQLSWFVAPGKPQSFELELLSLIDRELAPPESSIPSSEPNPPETELHQTNFHESMLRLNHRAIEWNHRTTRFLSDNEDFNEMMARSSKDIRMLMTQTPEGRYMAAGIPWYVALFGRDSIITSLFCLPLDPDLAKGTLKILAKHQGRAHCPERDEEPGKILHELRVGELARIGEIPHTPYYGSVDATPLWIILLYEYFRWTDDRETLDELWPTALAAMGWCDRNIDESPNGYCYYGHQAARGILQQGWKDSDDGVVTPSGEIARPPIALSEVQGYVYQARRHLGQIAELRGEAEFAQQLQAKNEEFRDRFNRDFWISDLEYCALGLDRNGEPLHVIASNPGHCIGSGILTDDHARKVARRIIEDDMFSGWGIRTLSGNEVAFNPMSYHNGSIWPHDNAIIARGFARIGETALVEKTFSGLFNSARHMFYKRLPELFCGFERSEGREADPPVRYPVACIPQAWAAASMYSLIQSMLNFTPNAAEKTLSIRSPKLPSWLDVLHVNNLRVGEARIDLAFRRSQRTVTVDVKDLTGELDVLVEITAPRLLAER